MSEMNLAYSVVLGVAFLQVGVPVFEIDVPPGEGPHEFEAASKVLNLRELPTASSRVSKTLTVSPNQRLSFDDTRYRTIRAGRIRVLVATRVTGRMIGAVSRLSKDEYYSDKFASVNIEVRPEMTFEYLQYRAEGTCFIRIESSVIDAGCPAVMKSLFKVEIEPKTELWIHVVFPGSSAGWLLVNGSTVKEVEP